MPFFVTDGKAAYSLLCAERPLLWRMVNVASGDQ